MRLRIRLALTALLSTALAMLMMTAVPPSPAVASQPPDPGPSSSSMPSDVPSSKTPQVDNGDVQSIVQVGSLIVMGGNFTSVNGQTYNHVAAFNASTGAVSTSFNPSVNGIVNAVAPGPNDHTVYVGGNFTKIGNTNVTDLALLDLNTGAIASGWTSPNFDYGEVRDLTLRGDHLYVGGTFAHVGGQLHQGLASLNPSTGAVQSFMNVQLSGQHNPETTGWVGVRRFDVTPDGSKMVAIGNFAEADGLPRVQIVMINLTGSSAAVDQDWNTDRYEPTCFSWAFSDTVRGISFSPNGSYFVVTSTGGGNPGTLCDAAAKWKTDATGSNVQPEWVAETGGDSLWGVTITDAAIFVGGHERWGNDPLGVDQAKAGAVPRPGLAALDPVSGRPFSWNPGRVPLGAWVYNFLATPQGIYLGSNTDYIGNYKYKRSKIAFFPYDGGSKLASTATGKLPGSLFLAGQQSGSDPNAVSRVQFDGTTASDPTSVDDGGIDWSDARGAFMVGDKVFYGSTDEYLHSRTYDGETWGPDVKYDPYHDPAWANVRTGVGTTTFNGAFPSLYGELPTVTGMFYLDGRLYYTEQGNSNLQWRWFSPDSGIVDETHATVTSSVDFSDADGMFWAGGKLYYVTSSDGDLHSIDFSGDAGASISGQPTTVSGPTIDGVDWRSRALFLYNGTPAGAPNQPPNAAFTSTCQDNGCAFDASTSNDPDGSISSYSWDFGDGTTGDGATPSHSYTDGGTYTVKLTVKDNDGATDTVSHDVTVSAPTANTLGFVGAAHSSAGAAKYKELTVPAKASPGDTMLLTFTQASNSDPVGPSGVTGWTQLGTFTNSSVTSTVWEKTVAAGDPGSTVRMDYSAYQKGVLSLTVYSGVDASKLNAQSVAHAGDNSTDQHTTPVVDASNGDWVVSYWADKSAGTTQWTAPNGVTQRDTTTGTGGGRYGLLTADSGGPVLDGSYGGLTATTNDTSARGVMWTILLTPSGPPAPNQPPNAAFTSTCQDNGCAFDASTSNDPDGSISSYSWDFGDGTTGDGATPSHSYTDGGTYTVKLTVKDNDGATDTVSHDVTVSAPTANTLGFVGAAHSSAGAAKYKELTVPAKASPGDTMLLTFTQASNSDPVGPSGVTGWTQLGTFTNSSVTSTVWEKTVAAGDPGSTVRMDYSAYQKGVLSLTVYSGVDASKLNAQSVAHAGDNSTDQHTTPVVDASNGDWVVSYWADKSAGTTQWTAPNGVTQRDTTTGTGGGRYGLLTADSGGPVLDGSYGGLTATTNDTSARGVMWTILLTPNS